MEIEDTLNFLKQILEKKQPFDEIVKEALIALAEKIDKNRDDTQKQMTAQSTAITQIRDALLNLTSFNSTLYNSLLSMDRRLERMDTNIITIEQKSDRIPIMERQLDKIDQKIDDHKLITSNQFSEILKILNKK